MAGNSNNKISKKLWLKNYSKGGPRLLFLLASFIFKHSNDWSVTESKIVQTIRDFCDKEEALFIVKGRVKKPIVKEISKVADFVFYDECFFPSTTIELLSISNLFISHFSMAVWEAINLGVYNINITLDSIAEDQTMLFKELFPEDWKDDLTKKGLNEIYTAKSFLKEFKQRRLDDFRINTEIQEKTAMKYFSLRPGFSSAHCVEQILKSLTKDESNRKGP